MKFFSLKVRPIFILILMLVAGLSSLFYGIDYFGRVKATAYCIVISKEQDKTVTVYVPSQRDLGSNTNIWDGNYTGAVSEWRWENLERGEAIYIIMECGSITGIPYYYKIQ